MILKLCVCRALDAHRASAVSCGLLGNLSWRYIFFPAGVEWLAWFWADQSIYLTKKSSVLWHRCPVAFLQRPKEADTHLMFASLCLSKLSHLAQPVGFRLLGWGWREQLLLLDELNPKCINTGLPRTDLHKYCWAIRALWWTFLGPDWGHTRADPMERPQVTCR